MLERPAATVILKIRGYTGMTDIDCRFAKGEDMAESAKNQSGLIKVIADAIEWGYERVVEPEVFGIVGAEELAEEYRKTTSDVETAIDQLIRWQVMQAGAAGFVTGIGGVFTLPVALPANIAAIIFIQLRMIAAIAHLRGYDIRSDRVGGLVKACIVGSSLTDILKDFGVGIGSKMSQKAVNQISGATLLKINQAVGIKLVTKAGTTGMINLTKIIPFIGGVVSGSIDATATLAIGSAAKKVFATMPVASEAETAQM